MSIKRLLAATKKKIGLNRGAPRIYMEGPKPELGGFKPGIRYRIDQHEREAVQGLVLRLDPKGGRVVSKKERSGIAHCVIDLNSAEMLAAFQGMEEVRVLIREGEIWILPTSVAIRRGARLARLERELVDGRISTAEVSHGIGVMANAIHKGLLEAGLHPELKWAIELEDDSLDHAMLHNDAWTDRTLPVAMPLQEVAFADGYVRDSLAPVSVLCAGLPCTAASRAGRAKKRLAQAEDDEAAGHLVLGFMALVAHLNPAIVALENVPSYHTTPGVAMLRTQLRELGYSLSEIELDGAQFAIEARVRRVLLAVTEGLEVDANAFTPDPYVERTLGDILDNIALDDPRWSSMDYLKRKEVRDKEDGKNFKMQVLDASVSHCGCAGRGYSKRRSTEPKVSHPTDPGLIRQFTANEHRKVKGIPAALMEGCPSETRAHEWMGQSVIWPAFLQLGKWLGASLKAHDASKNDIEVEQTFVLAAA